MDFITSAAFRLDQHRATELARSAEFQRRAAERETEAQAALPTSRRSWHWPAVGLRHAHGQ